MRQRARESAFPEQIADRPHEQLFDGDRLNALLERDLLTGVELELALAPPQHLQQQTVGLLTQRSEKLMPRQDATIDEIVGQPLAGGLVTLRHAREVLGAKHSLAREHLSQPLFEVLVESVGGDDLAAQKRDGENVVLTLHREDAGLLLLRDHLQNVGQTEDPEIAFERHGPDPYSPSPSSLRTQSPT